MTFILGLVWPFIKKWGLPLLGAIVIVAFVFYGVYHIYDAGEKTGFTKGAASRDQEVAALHAQITARDEAENARITAQNSKIFGLEWQSRVSAATIKSQEEQLQLKQQNVIASYATKNPQVAGQCGWSAPTTNAIRELLGAQ